MNETLFQVSQLVVGVGGTAGGLLLVSKQVRVASEIARGQNTMPFLFGEQIRAIREKKVEASNGIYEPGKFEQLSTETVMIAVGDKDCWPALRAKINYYEAISCAIEHGTLDEELYRTFASNSLRLTYWMYAHYFAYIR